MISSIKPTVVVLFLCLFLEGHTQTSTDSLSDLKTKPEVVVDDDLSLELGPENMILITKKSLDLLSSPGNTGKFIGKIKKGITVQQLDIIGDYILICYNGQCGYIPKGSLLREKVSKKNNITSPDTIPSSQSNKS